MNTASIYTIEHKIGNLVFNVVEIEYEYNIITQQLSSAYKSDKELKKFIVLVQNMGMDAPQWNPIPFVHFGADIIRAELESVLKERSTKMQDINTRMSKLWGMMDIDHTDELDSSLMEIYKEENLWAYMKYEANGHSIDLSRVDDGAFKIMSLEEWFDGH